MKLIENNGLNLIISHIADIDGLGAAILAKVIDSGIDIALVEVNELTPYIKQLNDSNEYQKYETIYITDLPVRNDAIEILNLNEDFSKRIVHYDHHTSEVKDNIPTYLHVEPVKNGIKTSGTTLFYDYLIEQYPNNEALKSEYTKDFVEAVRVRDNWESQQLNNFKGDKLSDLFTLFGPETFIDNYCHEITSMNKQEVTFDAKEMGLLKNLSNQLKSYIDLCDSKMIRTTLNGMDIGVVYAESYRSELGNALSNKYKDKLKFILIINILRGSISLRTVNKEIDLGALAKLLSGGTGGGQPQAAGFDINGETLYLVKDGLDIGYPKKLVK